MEAEFSKKMYQRLTDYETYMKEQCKSPLLQKDKVMVNREELLELIADLKAFHGVDQQLEDGGELEFSTVQMGKEQILKNALWQAKQIVSTTLTERRKELEDARKEVADSREGILQEARAEGEKILENVRQEAEELRKRLDEEIELYRQARETELKESLKEAQKLAQDKLEEKTREALKIYADTVHKTEEMVNLITALYEQQIEIIQQDRKDISAIVDKLERKGLQRR